MHISVYAILIWITAIVIGSLDIVILLGSKNISSRVFAFLTLVTGVWVASQGFLVATNSPEFANWLIRFQYVLGILITIGFYHFSIIYPYDKKISSKNLIVSISTIPVFAYLFFYTNTMVIWVHHIGGPGSWAWEMGPLNALFQILFCLLWIVILRKLFLSYKAASGELRMNLKNMFGALFLGIIPPTLANIVLPYFGIYHLNWIGPISSAIWIFITAYSIIRYRQMNVRAVITEVLAISMAAIFFANIFISEPFGIGARVATFAAFLIPAYFLIRGVLREAKQREELRELNLTLNQKVAEQTVEIRASYEAEKKARMELEKLNDAKDQFIMITQHHLRTPVTSLGWGLDELLKGTYGKIAAEARETIQDLKTSTGRLTRIVDDFLNITTIKVGTSILNLSLCSLKPSIEDILYELRADIAHVKLSVTYPKNSAEWPELKIDCSKVRESLFIIVENAVRYNQEGGSITISTKTSGESFELIVENTGIGITSDEQGKIGSALFYRGGYARTAYPIGMGIGLSVVKAIIRAHHGTFSIESRGTGKGAKVTVVLPKTS